jgi:hypothetical protein
MQLAIENNFPRHLKMERGFSFDELQQWKLALFLYKQD